MDFGSWLRSHGYNNEAVIANAVANPSSAGSAYQDFLRESGGGSSSGGGYQPISAPDLAKLATQAAGIIHPYYVELAKQAKGNFNEALRLMQADYTSGVKQAKEDYALATKYGQGDLKNALATLGLDFTKENEQTINDLNKRGVAVYQNNPNGTPNVVTGAAFNPTYDPNAYTYNPGVSGANPNQANLGQGGVEAERLRQSQALRAEATMRAGMKPLETAGITLKQATNAPTGFSAENPLNPNVDLSQAGSLEQKLAGQYQPQKESYLNTLQNQAEQERGAINQTATQYGNTQQKAIDEATAKRIQEQYNTSFIQGGVS